MSSSYKSSSKTWAWSWEWNVYCLPWSYQKLCNRCFSRLLENPGSKILFWNLLNTPYKFLLSNWLQKKIDTQLAVMVHKYVQLTPEEDRYSTYTYGIHILWSNGFQEAHKGRSTYWFIAARNVPKHVTTSANHGLGEGRRSFEARQLQPLALPTGWVKAKSSDSALQDHPIPE